MKESQLPLVTKQIGATHCGLASLAHFIELTEDQIHDEIGKVDLPKGLTLEQLSKIMDDLRVKHKILKFTNVNELKNEFEINWSSNKYIANFYIPDVYPGEGDFGHFSPLVAFQNDRVCIGDTWPNFPNHTWTDLSTILSAMRSIDKESGEERGLVRLF